MEYEFTSESVSIGHPDKVADLISDSIATFLLSKKQSYTHAQIYNTIFLCHLKIKK